MTTRPSGTASTRSTSRRVAWGSGLSSRVCGSTTRSRLLAGKGRAEKSAVQSGAAQQLRLGRIGQRQPAVAACDWHAAPGPRSSPAATRGSRRCRPPPGRTGPAPTPAGSGPGGLEPIVQTYNLSAHDPRSAARSSPTTTSGCCRRARQAGDRGRPRECNTRVRCTRARSHCNWLRF